MCDAFIAECLAHNPDWVVELEQIDLDGQPEILSKYSDLVPVVVIDGQVICQHFFDAAKLSPYFRS